MEVHVQGPFIFFCSYCVSFSLSRSPKLMISLFFWAASIRSWKFGVSKKTSHLNSTTQLMVFYIYVFLFCRRILGQNDTLLTWETLWWQHNMTGRHQHSSSAAESMKYTGAANSVSWHWPCGRTGNLEKKIENEQRMNKEWQRWWEVSVFLHGYRWISSNFSVLIPFSKTLTSEVLVGTRIRAEATHSKDQVDFGPVLLQWPWFESKKSPTKQNKTIKHVASTIEITQLRHSSTIHRKLLQI